MNDINLTIQGISFTLQISIIFKMALSCVIGSLIGKERKKNEKPGGSRTFSLICLGATLLAIISQELYSQYTFDFVRLMAYAIAGIGFLGSGVIIQNKNKIEGLTTASTMWAIVPIGFLVGLGYYFIGVVSTIFIYLILESKYKKSRIKRRKKK